MNDTARTRRLSGLDASFGGELSFTAAANSDDSGAVAARSRVQADALAPPQRTSAHTQPCLRPAICGALSAAFS